MEVELKASRARRLGAAVIAAAGFLAGSPVHAVGVAAGTGIDNTATATYEVGGVPQSPVQSNLVQLNVDEMLNANVIWNDAAPIAVTSPMTGAVLTFTVTNTGNGAEAFRFIAERILAGDDFDPIATSVFYETNGTPGLQVGVGGDTQFIAGGEVVIAADGTLAVYVAADVDINLPSGALSQVGLRAVAATLITGAGTDDPANPAFPAPGTSYAGAGDSGVDAVVGGSFDTSALAIRAEGTLRVSAAIVAITKSVVSVTDPFAGNTVVPGAVIRYAITVNVSGSGVADALRITDVLPAELEYVSSSLTASAPLPVGQELDDDRLPAGVDNTGFDTPSSTVMFDLGAVSGGSAPVTLGFDARVR